MDCKQVVAALTGDNTPEKVLASIPATERNEIPRQICKLLAGRGLSFQQAEMLLEVAKGRLRWTEI